MQTPSKNRKRSGSFVGILRVDPPTPVVKTPFLSPIKTKNLSIRRSSTISSPLEAKMIRKKIKEFKDKEDKLQSSILMRSITMTPSNMKIPHSFRPSTGKRGNKGESTISLMSPSLNLLKSSEKRNLKKAKKSLLELSQKEIVKTVPKSVVEKYIQYQNKEKKKQVKYQRKKKIKKSRTRYSAFSKYMSKYGRKISKKGDVVKTIKRRMKKYIRGEIVRREMQRRLWASNYIKKWWKRTKQRKIFLKHVQEQKFILQPKKIVYNDDDMGDNEGLDLYKRRVQTRDSLLELDKHNGMNDEDVKFIKKGEFSKVVENLSMIKKVERPKDFFHSIREEENEFQEIKEILDFVENEEKKKKKKKNDIQKEINDEKRMFDMIEKKEKKLKVMVNESEEKKEIEKLKMEKEKKIFDFFEKNELNSPMAEKIKAEKKKKQKEVENNHKKQKDVERRKKVEKKTKEMEKKEKTEMFNFFADMMRDEREQKENKEAEMKFRMRNKLRISVLIGSPSKVKKDRKNKDIRPKKKPRRFEDVKKETEMEKLLKEQTEKVGSFEIENGRIIHKRKNNGRKKIHETPLIKAGHVLSQKGVTEDVVVFTPHVKNIIKNNGPNNNLSDDISSPDYKLELELSKDGITSGDLKKFGLTKEDLKNESNNTPQSTSSVNSSISSCNSSNDGSINNDNGTERIVRTKKIENRPNKTGPNISLSPIKRPNIVDNVNSSPIVTKAIKKLNIIDSNPLVHTSSLSLSESSLDIINDVVECGDDLKGIKKLMNKYDSNESVNGGSVNGGEKGEKKFKNSTEELLQYVKDHEESFRSRSVNRSGIRSVNRSDKWKKKREEEEEEERKKMEIERVKRERELKEKEKAEEERKQREIDEIIKEEDERKMKEDERKMKELDDEKRKAEETLEKFFNEVDTSSKIVKNVKNKRLEMIKGEKENMSVSRVLDKSILNEFSVEVDTVKIEVEKVHNDENPIPTENDVAEIVKEREIEIEKFINDHEDDDSDDSGELIVKKDEESDGGDEERLNELKSAQRKMRKGKKVKHPDCCEAVIVKACTIL